MRKPKEKICDEQIGERIRSVLEHEGKRQADLARILGISEGAVSSMCAGKSSPSVQTITLICQHFGVRKEWLCTGTGSRYVNMDLRDELNIIVSELSKGIAEDSPKARFTVRFTKMLLDMDDAQIEKGIDALRLMVLL